jgi:hypothetical protein
MHASLYTQPKEAEDDFQLRLLNRQMSVVFKHFFFFFCFMDAGAKHIENHRSALLHVFDYVTPEYVSFPTELLDDESQSQEELYST